MLADRGKLVTALLGVTFAVVLVNLQSSLLHGFVRKACMLVEYGQADIWVVHRHMKNVDMGDFIPERWIHRIRGMEGVEKAEPYIAMFGHSRMPDGRFEVVMVVGCEPVTLMGNAWDMENGDASMIRHPDAILIDSCDVHRFNHPEIGDIREINGQKARIVGFTKNIVGFTYNPYVFTTLDRARKKYAIGIPPDHCSFYLIKAAPGTDIPELVQRIQERVPELAVYDAQTYSLMAMNYWLTKTGIGISFGTAALLGLIVGLAVVAQTLHASVNERLKEFATLKALGADTRCTIRFLLAQAVGSALLGSLLGLFLTLLLIQSPMNTP
ncbi:MAG: ABC transporter permease, partial [Gemmataceae bacterium]